MTTVKGKIWHTNPTFPFPKDAPLEETFGLEEARFDRPTLASLLKGCTRVTLEHVEDDGYVLFTTFEIVKEPSS